MPNHPKKHLSLPVILAGALVLLPTGAAAQKALFVDRAAETGLDFVHFNGMTGQFYLLEVTGSGAALVDYDNDGDLDVYLVQGRLIEAGKSLADAVFPPSSAEPPIDRLFRNDLIVGPNGRAQPTFVDVTEISGIRATGYGMGVAAGDYDRDGWTDLYITNFGSNQMLRNNGDGTFSDETDSTGTDDVRWSVPATFLDFDHDGWLDLFVGNYVNFSVARHQDCPSPTGAPDYCAPLSYEAEADRLFRNRGDGTFEDYTRRAGIAETFGNALGAVAADFDGDGRSDLYVANDMSPNQLWINQGDGKFRDDALISGSGVNEDGMPEASMGVVAGDVDADGDQDLFMTHLDGETNTLYINDGTGLFRDSTARWNLAVASQPFTAFGTAWLDFDNDGQLDLIVANGAVAVIEELARKGDPYPLDQTNQLFRNEAGAGGDGFTEVTRQAGSAFEVAEVSRGIAVGDVDNDGRTDILLANNAGPARLLMAEPESESAANDWIGLSLAHAAGSPAQGARVAIHRRDAATLWRTVQTGGSYASASDARILVGLGPTRANQPVIEKVEFFWPDGRVDTWTGLTPGRYNRVTAMPPLALNTPNTPKGPKPPDAR